MQQKKSRANVKVILICTGLLIAIAIGTLLTIYWPSTPQSKSKQAQITTHTSNALFSDDSLYRLSPVHTRHQVIAVQPAHHKPVQSAVAKPQYFSSIPHSEEGIDVIRSAAPQPSNWHGLFNAGKRSRMVQLHPTLLNGQPLPKGTRLHLQLFDDVQIEAVVVDSFSNVNGTVTTTAKLTDSTWGRVFIASTNGQLHARIRISETGKIYAIQYNPETNHHYSLELDPELAEPDAENDQLVPPQAEADEADDSSTSENNSEMQSDESTDTFSVIDVMVVYTDDALAAAGSQASIDNNIALAISMANDAYKNTNISMSSFLVHSYEVDYDETGSNSEDLECITKTDDCLDDIQTQRDTYGADFVILMNATGGPGIGWILQTTSGNDAYAYSVVNVGSFSSYTPAHEVGHNMGLSHAADQLNDTAGPTQWYKDDYEFGTSTAGWHWHPTADATGFASIMTYTGGSYFSDGLSHLHVGIFSDPNIQDHGMPAGHATEGYNAQVLRQLRQTYADYRSRFSNPIIQVDSPNGGEMLIAGHTYSLLWDSYGVNGNVKIELLRNGNLYQVIASDTLNDRIYTWTVPRDLSGTDFAIRISSLDGTLTDTSDAVFKIATVFYEEPLDIDPGYTINGNCWEFGQPVAQDNATYGGPADAYTGTNIYDTNLDGVCFEDSILTSVAIDCSNYLDVHLKFMGQFSVDDTDSATVQISTNGTGWTNLYTVKNQWATRWVQYEFDISSIADGQSTVYIRWIYDNDSSSSYSGMSVDDIQLLGRFSQPVVSLGIDQQSIEENNGRATVTATLSQTADSTVSVALAFSGTATKDVDYTATETSITIDGGSISGSITLQAIDDGEDETDETVVVDINSVTNAVENAIQQVNTILIDNDHTITFRTDKTPGASLAGETVQIVTQGNDCSPVTAKAPDGYVFTGWSGGISSINNPLTLTNISSSLLITANFAIKTYTLMYTSGENGTVTGESPQIIDHGADATPVTAVPDNGYHFVQWSDGSNQNPRTDTQVTDNIDVTAIFAVNTYTLTYTAGKNGTVTGESPQIIGHGADATPVTAVPDNGYHFVQWSDGSYQNPRTDTQVTGNIDVTAIFAIGSYLLDLYFAGNGSGTVMITTSDLHNECRVNCTTEFEWNTNVTLSAVTDEENSFAGWLGDGCSGTTDCTVTMTQARTITAVFKVPFPWNLFLQTITSQAEK